jgi:hypothetical protein
MQGQKLNSSRYIHSSEAPARLAGRGRSHRAQNLLGPVRSNRRSCSTISDGSNFWLSDRELARRPWVYNPASSQVDALLMENSEAAAKLKWRLFPESYAIHWAEEKAH